MNIYVSVYTTASVNHTTNREIEERMRVMGNSVVLTIDPDAAATSRDRSRNILFLIQINDALFTTMFCSKIRGTIRLKKETRIVNPWKEN